MRDYSEEEIIEKLNNPQNGNGDIYWVDAKIIEDLRPKDILIRLLFDFVGDSHIQRRDSSHTDFSSAGG